MIWRVVFDRTHHTSKAQPYFYQIHLEVSGENGTALPTPNSPYNEKLVGSTRLDKNYNQKNKQERVTKLSNKCVELRKKCLFSSHYIILGQSLNIFWERLGKYLTARVTSGQSAGDSSGSELAKNV